MSLDATLQRMFAAIRAEARDNPRFAAKLARAIDAGVPPRAASPRRPAPALDPVAVMRADGEARLREALADLSRADIYAVVRARELEPKGASAFNRARLIEHVVSVARRAAGGRKSPLDY